MGCTRVSFRSFPFGNIRQDCHSFGLCENNAGRSKRSDSLLVLSFEEAKRKAESRDSGEGSGPNVPKRPRTRDKPGAGRKFMDDTAGVGR